MFSLKSTAREGGEDLTQLERARRDVDELSTEYIRYVMGEMNALKLRSNAADRGKLQVVIDNSMAYKK